ncbi:hypothetical protein SAMN05661091_1233 [Paenibacillus uliginis N3/975]|uniref:Uncharacterized protein n=1 Tax=Paenibacillus uliginis N3/975 TaxID=1313296 RepID=A0A1X7GWJ4_9BACL|nr:hypothetical protein SAMN05661091_1233 [Paenibacillus uliginis N3/975]
MIERQREASLFYLLFYPSELEKTILANGFDPYT